MVTIGNKKCLFLGLWCLLEIIAAYKYILEKDILSSNTLKYYLKCTLLMLFEVSVFQFEYVHSTK